MMRTLTPAFARAFAHMSPAGPAPMTRTSTSLSLMSETGIAGEADAAEYCRGMMLDAGQTKASYSRAPAHAMLPDLGLRVRCHLFCSI